MKLTAKTLYGLENILAKELEDLGASDIKPVNRAVLFSGDRELMYRVNYCSRTALSVLMQIADFHIRSKEDLYRKTAEIDWSEFMDSQNTFSVVHVVNSKLFDHTGYPGLIVKDAVADYFRRSTGSRPSVDSADPTIIINLHISNNLVNISLDSSAIPLFRRGYRSEHGIAPLNEVLAAGILLISGWNASASILDPMCGSGTIPIEAGLIANRIPPGKFRSFFGFSRWKDFDRKLFERVKKDSDNQIIKSSVKIKCSDISEKAVKISAINIARAGLSEAISAEVADFKNLKAFDNNGYVFMNPPYGKRIRPGETEKLYDMIGSALKHNFAGNRAWIITSDKEYLKNIGLKPGIKYTLYNGPIECILAGYELYEGTRKQGNELKSA
jgi:putative N6-adenine-specific DNA methylase